MPKVKEIKNRSNSVAKEEEVVVEEKPTVQSSLEVLQTQLVDYQKNAEHFSKMVLKCQGAIEVLLQLTEGEEDGES
tara:strand:+ start:988 stop:1215 length:228 start_codon:yes stop_codon:yes gene_type:complete